MEYILLADSGSTKTDWVLTKDGCRVQKITTQGINPFMLGKDEIVSILKEELFPHLRCVNIDSVCFYGAGCRGEQRHIVAEALREVLHAPLVEVDSDMLGAARLLCGENEGIVCILGTGSNSCLYDGRDIVENVSPLGFILGDEGSGAVLGRRLLGDILKRQLPDEICEAFHATCRLSSDEIIQRVYREKFPNRFLASFAPFIKAHLEECSLREMVLDEFSRFFKRNVANYHRTDLPVHFVGSVGFYFQAELKEAAEKCGFKIGKVRRAPLEVD